MVSLLFSLLFAVLGSFFLFVAVLAGFGLFHMLRSSERSRRYLAEAKEDAPLQLDHLSAPLRRLAQDTRLLRISLDGPIREVGDYRRGELQAASGDIESFDAMLMDLSRQLADWVQTVERLDERDRNVLIDMGLGVDPIRAALDFEGGAFERRNLMRTGAPPMDQRLQSIVAELDRFEAGLQVAPRPYR